MGRWAQRQRGRGAGVKTVRETIVTWVSPADDGALFYFDQPILAVPSTPDGNVQMEQTAATDAVQDGPLSVNIKYGFPTIDQDDWAITGTPICVIPAPGSGPIVWPQSGLILIGP